ncbi:MAG TPA: 16S rRNA (guanine(527)-N(7))-methyltransferase RsmG [Chloroflexaceae bacterium]|mgnify:CR=1 FL=1|nr:16S rRNA (guanine(527)-N(7))-methyltransferase RsmG [Chloroflexaceae bacterium]
MTDHAERLLAQTCEAWGFPLSDEQLARFRVYADELAAWNAHTNLTAIGDREGVYVRHFLDSLALAPQLGPAPGSLIDLGTGAGFPGVPLKLLRPELKLTLVDSVGKKTAFLVHLVSRLGLRDARVVTARAEELGRDPAERERYGVVTARAVADLRVLAEYGLPLLGVGGRMLAPKGAGAQEEAAAAARAIGLLGGELAAVEPVALPGVEPRALVIIAKVAPTDRRYPRPVGVPARKPL